MTGAPRSQPINGHTSTPWKYRPWEHDDWGWIRGPEEHGEKYGPLVALARCGKETLVSREEHRQNKTDPYEANARFIVEAVNNYAALKARVADLEGALQGIEQYGSDTLSGRVDGPDDRDWQREGVREMRDRARAALSHAGTVARDGER